MVVQNVRMSGIEIHTQTWYRSAIGVALYQNVHYLEPILAIGVFALS